MAFLERSYSGAADQRLMQDLARRFPQEHLHVIDLPYRLSSWAFDEPQNAGLWFGENGELLGWAALQTPFWTVDITCIPAAEQVLYPEILRWADRRARAALATLQGHPAWFINVFAGQAQRLRHLEEAGFRCQAEAGEDSWSKVLMRRSDPAPVRDYPPPAGYVVRSLAGEAEVPAYVVLHQSVFESENMTLDWRLRTLRQPAYRPDLDLVVASPDGRLAAFCVCWYDPVSRYGQVEPLGCHKDFRRFALGRVALAEGLRRLQTLGAQDILVETDSYRNTAYLLYESFDFQVVQGVLVYRKDYGAG